MPSANITTSGRLLSDEFVDLLREDAMVLAAKEVIAERVAATKQELEKHRALECRLARLRLNVANDTPDCRRNTRRWACSLRVRFRLA